MILLRLAGLALLLGCATAGLVWFGWELVGNLRTVASARAMAEGENGSEETATESPPS